ncbi:MAG: hypothetical protein H7834_10535, partial [Magnetococcus sp. YQC-9]
MHRVVSKRQKTTPAKAARGALEERAKVKSKTLGDESPIYGPPRFARKNFHRVNQRKVASIY